jgi:hypothetical protein
MEVFRDRNSNRVYLDKGTKKTITPPIQDKNFESDEEREEIKQVKKSDEKKDSRALTSLGTTDSEEERNEDLKENPEKVELPLGWKDPDAPAKKRYADITKDLEKYDFPSIVKTKAIELGISLKLKPHKNKPKLQQIFFLITSAYAECGQLCDDNRIAKELGLKQTDINQSRAIYNQVRTGYKKPEVPSKISNWILTYISDICLSEDLKEDVDYLIKSILVKEKNLRKEDSKITARAKKVKDYYRPDIALAGILYELEIRTIFTSKDRKNKEKLINQLGRKPNVVIFLLNYMKNIDNSA